MGLGSEERTGSSMFSLMSLVTDHNIIKTLALHLLEIIFGMGLRTMIGLSSLISISD